MLVHNPEIDGELIHDGESGADSDGKAEAEVLALGVGSAGGVGEHKADAGFEVGNDWPAFLDKVIAWAEEAACKPWRNSVLPRFQPSLLISSSCHPMVMSWGR
jgi:hypothetical protein